MATDLLPSDKYQIFILFLQRDQDCLDCVYSHWFDWDTHGVLYIIPISEVRNEQ
jgi:hypothetical protein